MLGIPRVGVSVHLYSGKTPCKKPLSKEKQRSPHRVGRRIEALRSLLHRERAFCSFSNKEEKRAQRSVICNEALGLGGCGRVTSFCFDRGKRLSGVIRTPVPQKMTSEGRSMHPALEVMNQKSTIETCTRNATCPLTCHLSLFASRCC